MGLAHSTRTWANEPSLSTVQVEGELEWRDILILYVARRKCLDFEPFTPQRFAGLSNVLFPFITASFYYLLRRQQKVAGVREPFALRGWLTCRLSHSLAYLRAFLLVQPFRLKCRPVMLWTVALKGLAAYESFGLIPHALISCISSLSCYRESNLL